MSVAIAPTWLSNPRRKQWVVTVLVVIVIVSPAMAHVVSSAVEALALASALGAAGTATMLRGPSSQSTA
ncbi:hypothetical protein ABZ990_23340 [Streptomyces sp. NPDC046203]|uniref:hypothetical protein n=1 Tax=Streptomyces sp. NPDC046203 TaxID=3154602 RepID=UPI0033D57C2F